MRILLLFACSLLLSSPVPAAKWDFGDNSLGMAVGNEAKTQDEQYEGTKINLDVQYFLKSVPGEVSEKRKCCVMPSLPTRYYGLFDASLRAGFEGTGLERIRLEITPKATLWEPVIESQRKFRATRDLFELGAVRFISDDALEVDSYLEVSIVRAGRLGTYKWSADSPFTVTLGGQASAGWAWAETKDSLYSEVSNPMTGLFVNLAIEHVKWGRLYALGRWVNGFSFSSPARGHPTAREANVRFGYLKQVHRRLELDVFGTKRSFNFTEGSLPGLYTWSRTIGVELSWFGW